VTVRVHSAIDGVSESDSAIGFGVVCVTENEFRKRCDDLVKARVVN